MAAAAAILLILSLFTWMSSSVHCRSSSWSHILQASRQRPAAKDLASMVWLWPRYIFI